MLVEAERSRPVETQTFLNLLRLGCIPNTRRALMLIPHVGRILDAGCGSGRDAKAFLEAGYAVKAFDASPAMVRLASQFTSLPVQCMTFSDMTWVQRFDGIWASASLLHVPRADLPRVAERFRRALKPEGVCFVSFKHGTKEREKDGRHFTDMTDTVLQAVVSTIPGLSTMEVWVSEDVRADRQGEQWLNACFIAVLELARSHPVRAGQQPARPAADALQ